MGQKTIFTTVQAGLCCSCGVCKGICPKGCISWSKKDGLYVPQIDEQVCIHCSMCASVCPGLGHNFETAETAAGTVTGPVLRCYNAWSKDPELRHVGASGGVVSTIIRELLVSGVYDGAFCLGSYDYRDQLKTRLYTAEEVATCWNESNTPKSRYLPVSHENAVAYIKAHRNARLIFVGTSCAIRGLQAAIKKLTLERKQYLLIGLFCDKVFNYNVIPYFEDTYSPDAPLEALHFKNKESGGWPGDMKFFPKGRKPFYRPLADRMKAKAYFMPERCLYCVDKLNTYADISLGDNYTGKDDSKLGSNSVIIRTKIGESAWNAARDQLEIRNISIAEIQQAQAIDWRLNNLYFGDLKAGQIGNNLELNSGVPREKEVAPFKQPLKTGLKKLRAGAKYDINPTELQKQIRNDNKKPSPAVSIMKRCYHYIKRKIK
ncbi:MAG: hypothetical protein HPZ79_02175 [Oscillospiraceae bacterium]|nr:hypothetical protein [Oscillospiraceae bacterium]